MHGLLKSGTRSSVLNKITHARYPYDRVDSFGSLGQRDTHIVYAGRSGETTTHKKSTREKKDIHENSVKHKRERHGWNNSLYVQDVLKIQ